MVRTGVGRGAAAAATMAAVLALTGCGAGQVTQTSEQITMPGGAQGQVGEIVVRAAQFNYDRPVPGGLVYAPGTDALLQVTIVNEGTGADRLVSVSSPIATSGAIVGDTRLPGGQVLTSGYDQPVASITTGEAEADEIGLVGLTSPVRAGLNYPVVFTFERAGTLRLPVPVETPDVLPPRVADAEPDEARTLETGPEVHAGPGEEEAGPR
jgi:hypothetical protein